MAAAARDYQKVPSFLFLLFFLPSIYYDEFDASLHFCFVNNFMFSNFSRIDELGISYVNECSLKTSSLCELMFVGILYFFILTYLVDVLI